MSTTSTTLHTLVCDWLSTQSSVTEAIIVDEFAMDVMLAPLPPTILCDVLAKGLQ